MPTADAYDVKEMKINEKEGGKFKSLFSSVQMSEGFLGSNKVTYYYFNDSVLDIARALYERDNCRSVSEFICKAIQFYGGYVANTNMNPDYVPQVVLSTLKSIMHDSENRHNGSLFRIAVEISMIKNLLAIRQGISDVPLNKLRNDYITEVKKINGTISYEDAIRWQL